MFAELHRFQLSVNFTGTITPKMVYRETLRFGCVGLRRYVIMVLILVSRNCPAGRARPQLHELAPNYELYEASGRNHGLTRCRVSGSISVPTSAGARPAVDRP